MVLLRRRKAKETPEPTGEDVIAAGSIPHGIRSVARWKVKKAGDGYAVDLDGRYTVAVWHIVRSMESLSNVQAYIRVEGERLKEPPTANLAINGGVAVFEFLQKVGAVKDRQLADKVMTAIVRDWCGNQLKGPWREGLQKFWITAERGDRATQWSGFRGIKYILDSLEQNLNDYSTRLSEEKAANVREAWSWLPPVIELATKMVRDADMGHLSELRRMIPLGEEAA